MTVAEDAENELWQRLTLLVCAASSEAAHANAMLSQVVQFVEETRPDLELSDYEVEDHFRRVRAKCDGKRVEC